MHEILDVGNNRRYAASATAAREREQKQENDVIAAAS